ncbi:MAG: glycosyltransferase [Acidimicrobiaceae bacterium]|nr:glycosyltransferase [Acidimicrobiaceae bacterium]
MCDLSPLIHHFTAVLAGRDAVSRHTLAVDALLREMGCRTRIFAEHIHPDMRGKATDFREHPEHLGPDLLLYQMSTGSPVAEYLLTRSEPIVLNYHNITPAHVFDPWEPQVAVVLTQARRQLRELTRRAQAAIAVSDYNAQELRVLGLADVVVVPVLWGSPEAAVRSGSSELLGLTVSSDGQSPLRMLFVGRIAPNKRHEDLISALALLKRWHPLAQLVFVGASSSPNYESHLKTFAHKLGVFDSVRFAGSVSTDELNEHYADASVYVSASTHEGFCVPLLEAMSVGLPVVAVAAAAVPETTADAAVLLDSGKPLEIALAVNRLHVDESLRTRLVKRGFQRFRLFEETVVKQQMRNALECLLEVHVRQKG